ncbi:MAG: type I restriction enzyme HsdR N-terminal domain-containing protein [Deltaproteobacteria bacterium]|nr:type I restriction enzyme HsdR N-terminal domain-containing protein [Deltaproteobacteria bacterium]MBW2317171.1 type I restriction enzyme HsdR N-terminal domain-containing protein [Deltaproteobacteria bacterium]OEU45617.1 MAG: hypothetical protein BBJ60_10970 [Desulfobacterales bacterium S7086C20]
MSTEHLILGKTIDFITGETILDTHDERARQTIARFLVEKKGYFKGDISVRQKLEFFLDGNNARVGVDFIIRLAGKVFAIVIFGPGSLVSRERPAVAAARLLESYAVPFVVVTNGKDAEILETSSGAVIAEGLEAIPSKEEAMETIKALAFERVPENRLEKEKRILYAFEVLAERECDEYTCSI